MKSFIARLVAILPLVAAGAVFAGPPLMFAAYIAATAKTAPPLYTDVSTVQRMTLGGLGRTSSWCEPVTTAAENLWASSRVPSELSTASARSLVRWERVNHMGNQVNTTNDDTVACIRLGPDTDAPSLTCAPGAVVDGGAAPSENGDPLLGKGTSKTYADRPITTEGVAADAVVPIWARAAGSYVILCVTVGW